MEEIEDSLAFVVIGEYHLGGPPHKNPLSKNNNNNNYYKIYFFFMWSFFSIKKLSCSEDITKIYFLIDFFFFHMGFHLAKDFVLHIIQDLNRQD